MRKGHINKGFVKKTNNQRKKHFSQFSKGEFVYLENKIKKLDLKQIKSSRHLNLKSSISYKKDDIIAVLSDEDIKNRIIEFNITPSKGSIDRRVLLRSKEEYDVLINNNIKKCNLCFVISIITGDLITVYYNESNDSHDTIDWRRYDNDLQIIDM